MNTTNIMIQWEKFKDHFPRLETAGRLLNINNDFDLEPVFYSKDLEKILSETDQCLDAIREIKQELGI